MSRPVADRGGAVLLEALVALALLTTIGISIVGVVGEAVGVARQHAEREALVDRAHRLLVTHALLSRTDLDKRLGIRRYGELLVDVQRPEPDLYRIAVGDEGGEVLVTVVHRSRGEG